MARRRSQSSYEFKARRSCEAVCTSIKKRAWAAHEAGKKKQGEHYANAYWRCVTDCFPTKLPKWHADRRKKGGLR